MADVFRFRPPEIAYGGKKRGFSLCRPPSISEITCVERRNPPFIGEIGVLWKGG
jgi:hypothetical protein